MTAKINSNYNLIKMRIFGKHVPAFVLSHSRKKITHKSNFGIGMKPDGRIPK